MRQVVTGPLSRLRSGLYQWRYDRRYPAKNDRMQAALRRYRECDTRKPDAQIREEMKASQAHWGCRPWFYYRYDLFRKDRLLTPADLLRYIPEYFLYNVYNPLENSSPLAGVLASKTATTLFFRSLGIRCARQLLFSRGGQVYDQVMNPIPAGEALRHLSVQRGRHIFLKPDGGGGGEGVVRWHVDASGAVTDGDDRPVTAEDLARLLTGQDTIVEEGLVQLGAMDELYPHSVNSIRIATECHKGRSRLVFAALRLGAGGRCVDNVCQDGLALGVDLNSGELQPQAINRWEQHFNRHPDTGFEFAGRVLPEWSKVVDFVLDAALRAPFFRHVGWDIALTPEGPAAIEANLGYEIDLPQQLLGGLSDALGIGDPAPLWERHRRRFC
jgi:hypothetical protein